jgi:4-amino-4-deoxychorismate lyase
MSLLIESIKLLNGEFHNVSGHERRMKRSLLSLFGSTRSIDLKSFLSEGDFPREGLYKCRVLYDATILEKSFAPYEPRSVNRVKSVRDDMISYDFKFADRTHINRLFNLRGDCDDVLIIRQGKVTDCSYANIAFRKGREWFTSDSPLLQGTMRQKLIAENKIAVREIREGDIRSFDSFKLINAMLEFDCPEIEVSEIVF